MVCFFFDTCRSPILRATPPFEVSYSLVGYDEQGHPIGLHPGLGNLPLHLDMDGWYSVLGSWNCAADNPNPANQISEANPENNLAILVPPRNAHPSLQRIFCLHPKCSGNRLAVPFDSAQYSSYCIILTCTDNSLSGPHTCAPGRFTCKAPNCTWSGIFKTKQAFNRHYRAIHLSDRVDCPIEGCVRVGAHGIKRSDNLAAHILNKHGI